MPTTELIFDLVKKHPGVEISVGFDEKHDWFEIDIRYRAVHIIKVIPPWLSEMYGVETVNRTITCAVEELAANLGGEKK